MGDSVLSNFLDDVKIVKRGRGQVLLNGGHQYYLLKRYKNLNSIWRCKNFKVTKCNGTVTVTEDQSQVLKTSTHAQTCLPNENDNTLCSIICNSIETAALNIEETVSTCYKKTVSSVKDKGLDLISKLPTFNKYRCVTYRRRRKLAKVEKIVYADLEKVTIPPTFEDFLLGDYNDQANDRILLFASKEARELLKHGKIFLGDGTFKRCPKPFKQLYVVFCDQSSSDEKNNVVPVVYALMPNKLKKSYCIMFDMIKSQIPEWEPSKFITDFEQAAITAIKTTFPHIKHHGCYFHFVDKIKKKAKQLMLVKRYKKNGKNHLNKIISLCMVLPLLPEPKIEEGLNYILNESDFVMRNKNLQLFLSYIQNYWMTKKALWCSFGERHRTTNVCEGWNGEFNKQFKRRPTIMHLLKILKQDATFNAVNAVALEPAKKRSKNVVERNAYILHVQMQLVNGEIDVPLFLEKLR